jgi:O-antigen/teichoic acid export membrane protein
VVEGLSNHMIVITVVRLTGLGLSFALSVILARLLGPAGFGGYTYLLSWVTVFGMIGSVGLDNLLVREVSFCTARSDWRKLRGLLTWSVAITGLGALLMASIALYNPEVWLVPAGNDRNLFPITLAMIVGYPFFMIQLAILRGLGRIKESQCIENILPPLIMLSLVITYAAISRLTLSQALLANLIAICVTVVIVFWRTLRAIPKVVLAVLPSFEYSRWMTSAGHLVLLSGLNVVSMKIDCLLLGFLSGNEQLGLYAAVVRGANLISLPFSLVVITIAPIVARFHAEGRLQDITKQVVPQLRYALLTGLCIALSINIGSHWFLGFFGKGFEEGGTALAILSVGQLFNVAAGPVACLLMMTHHERTAVIGIILGTTVTCLSGLMLIAPFGSNGAAVASSLGLIAWNLFMIWSVWKSLGISPLVFGGTNNTRVIQSNQI